MKANKILAVFLLIGILASCNRNEVYFEYRTVDAGGWSKDSLQVYNIDVKDSISKFNIYLHVRHYGTYPYQNLWMFIDYKDMKDSIPKHDTIECYLADEYGKWIGNGTGALRELPVFIRKNVQFPSGGKYQISIRHGMRDSLLTGINKIGIRVEKSE